MGGWLQCADSTGAELKTKMTHILGAGEGSIFKGYSPLFKVKWKTQCDFAGLNDKSTCYYSLICSVHGEFSHRSFYSQELTAHHNTQFIGLKIMLLSQQAFTGKRGAIMRNHVCVSELLQCFAISR